MARESGTTRQPAWIAGICALCAACADVQPDATAFEAEPVGREPRALRMVERPLQTSAEVATMLERVQRTKDELARFAYRRARDAEVREHASLALEELAEARSELVRNCTALRGESAWVERVTVLGQELLGSLQSARDERFDVAYLSAVSALDGQLLELLSDQVDPPYLTPEADELSRLRGLLNRQRTRVERIQERMAPLR